MDVERCCFNGFQEIANCSVNCYEDETFFKEIIIKAGNTNVSKYLKPSFMGGVYAFKHNNVPQSPSRNRFIYWSLGTSNIELTDTSYDLNLSEPKLKITFHDASITTTPSFHETTHHTILLISTNTGFFKFTFPHPSSLLKNLAYSTNTSSILSIFSTIHNLASCLAPSDYHLFTSTPNPNSFTSASSIHLSDESSIFTYTTSKPSIIIFYLPSSDEGVTWRELNQTGMVSRFIEGIVTTVVSKESKTWPEDGCVCMCLHEEAPGRTIIITVTSNYHIKIWSASTCELLLNVDLISLLKIDHKMASSQAGVENIVKIHTTDDDDDVYVGVFLNISSMPQLHQFVLTSHPYALKHTCMLQINTVDRLIDYSFDEKIVWVLFEPKDDAPIIKYKMLQGGISHKLDWQDVVTNCKPPREPSINPCIYPSLSDNPHEHNISMIYINAILVPDTFDNYTLAKALVMYLKGTSTHIENHSTLQQLQKLNRAQLRERMVQAVDFEVHFSMSEEECELGENEVLQLKQQHWSLLFKNCCHVHEQRHQKAHSITYDPRSGMLVVSKDKFFSTLRPCGVLEDLSSLPYILIDELKDIFPDVNFSKGQLKDLRKLCACVNVVLDHVVDDDELSRGINRWQSLVNDTEVIALQLANQIFQSQLTNREGESLERMLQEMGDSFGSCINLIIDLLTAHLMPSHYHHRIDEVDDDNDDAAADRIDLLLSTSKSINIISTSMKQSSQTICQLIYPLITLVHYHKLYYTGDIEENLMIHNLRHLLSTHNCIVWAASTLVQEASVDCWEETRKILTTIGGVFGGYNQSAILGGMTLLELYVANHGLEKIKKRLDTRVTIWTDLLFAVITHLQYCMLAELNHHSFSIVLLSHCQQSSLQTYLHHLLFNHHTCLGTLNFLLALSLFADREYEEAESRLEKVVMFVGEEEVLMSLVQQASANQIEENFLLLLIKLFESFDQHSRVVSLANHALKCLPLVLLPDTTLTMWVKIFRHELLMGNYSHALDAILHTPKPSMRIDCLKQLLIVLCDKKQFDVISRLSFNFLQTEAEKFLEVQARCSEPPNHRLYQLLYSLNVSRKNYRMGADVMFELGWRLSSRDGSLQGVVEAYRVALNCLCLVQPQFAWVVKPSPNTHKKTGYGGVVDMDQLRAMLFMASSMLNLADAHLKNTPTSGTEVVTLLNKHGHFRRALKLCRFMSLSFVSVFEALTMRCISLTNDSHQRINADWLKVNDVIDSVSNQHLSMADKSFELLKELLNEYEPVHKVVSDCHKRVCVLLLIHKINLPAWMVDDYKKLNVDELIRVNLQFDMLSEACDLLLSYIEAVDGKKKEDFALKDYLHTGSAPVVLPYTLIDRILFILKESSSNHPAFQKMHKKITDTLQRHFKLVESTAQAQLYSANQMVA